MILLACVESLVYRVVVIMVIFIALFRIFLNFPVGTQVNFEDKVAVECFAASLAREHLLRLPCYRCRLPLLRGGGLGPPCGSSSTFSLLFLFQLEDTLSFGSGFTLKVLPLARPARDDRFNNFLLLLLLLFFFFLLAGFSLFILALAL